MKYFSTFSGIGGFELGIEQAYALCNVNGSAERGSQTHPQGDETERLLSSSGEDSSSEERPFSKRSDNITDQRPLCIGYSEIDKYATAIYQKHFPYEQCERCRTKNEGQGVQGAGDTEGFNSERDNISTVGLTCSCRHKPYGDITKIVAEDLPDFDLLVGGFPCQAFSIAGKRRGFEDTRGTMFFELARILRAKQPRLFVFENVKGLLSHDNGNTFRTIIAAVTELGYDCQWQVLNSKNHGVPQNRERVFIIGHLRGTPRPQVFPFGHNSKTPTELSGQHSNTLTTRYYGGQANGTYVLESKLDAQNINQPFIQNPKMLNFKKDYENSVAITATSYKEPPVVNAIRRLTPTECERLQGFPDGWTEGVSDSQRYKCLGNAVTVNVIRDIFQKII